MTFNTIQLLGHPASGSSRNRSSTSGAGRSGAVGVRSCLGALLATAAVACAPPSGAARAASTMSAAVSLSGLEINSSVVPGKVNVNYVAPRDSELAYYQSKGIMLVRLPVVWNRLQPALLSSPSSAALDPTYLGLIRQVIAEAGARGMSVVVDLHDFGGYNSHKIGDGVLTAVQFAALWQLLATALAGSPGLGGYDLMNEPSGMPSASAWPVAAQAAVDAIRTVDQTTNIFVEGDFYANVNTWDRYNANLDILDPANRLAYEGHVYGDRDSSGTHFDWNTEASYGVTVDTIAQRLQPFEDWCTANHHTCVIGEIGVGNDDPNWNVQLANGLAAAQRAGIAGFAYWAGGPWWGSYPMSIEPDASGDRPQMDVVDLYRE